MRSENQTGGAVHFHDVCKECFIARASKFAVDLLDLQFLLWRHVCDALIHKYVLGNVGLPKVWWLCRDEHSCVSIIPRRSHGNYCSIGPPDGKQI